MNDAILSMMQRYECKNSVDYENALKEIVQEVALQGAMTALAVLAPQHPIRVSLGCTV